MAKESKLNLEIERLEQRIAPGYLGGFGAASNGSKDDHGSKSSNGTGDGGGSKDCEPRHASAS